MSTNKYNTKVVNHKPGRTLLIKPNTSIDLNCIDTFDGFQTKHFTEKSNSYFVTFATPEQSNSALNQLKSQFGNGVNIKYAHYRVYFTMIGLQNESDYGAVKAAHTGLVTSLAKCNVLYYRLYRKNNGYIGCGDMTVDTKEGFDALMNQEVLKNYTVESLSLTGIHYKYNKTPSSDFNYKPAVNRNVELSA
jgi:hypothetical protein